MPIKQLTLKQQLFVYEYLIDLNATQAAIRSGYSKKTAYSIGSENLKKPEIKSAIQMAAAERLERIQIDADWVLCEQVDIYKRCAQAKPVTNRKGEPIMVEAPDGSIAPAYTFDSAGANRALENIGKHINVNAFKATDENDVPIDMNWTVTIVDGVKEDLDMRGSDLEHYP